MKSLSELMVQLALSPAGQPVSPNGWRLLQQIRTEGSVVIVKFDGERTWNCCTVMILGGPLGEHSFRKDGDDLEELIEEGINFYDGLVWRGQTLATPDSPPSGQRG
ncbi:MAG: hypothetical protein EOP86_06880 [Verrucomicrobiaceae bacterium]|nr:MAG: hypothetical protein EOP86_06880 [Verrucomicrobiaceae bacterium]